MTIQDWLEAAIKRLDATDNTTPRLDASILLEDATGKDRACLLAYPEFEISSFILKELDTRLKRRCNNEPLAYIRGKSEFYGRKFIVNKNVLVPRPETEAMIELLEQLVKSQKSKVVKNFTIIDVGTGSGCLAVTAKLEFPQAKVIATDISSACLKIAEQNAKMHGAKVTFYQGDLLQPLPSTVYSLPPTIILANLPYVPNDYAINQAATHEPKQAIFGGPDGLKLYRRLFDQITRLPHMPNYVFTESLPFQHHELAAIAVAGGYELNATNDFIQCFASKG